MSRGGNCAVKHKKTKAPSTRHPQSKALQSLHGVNASSLIEASMMLHNGPATAPDGSTPPATGS